MANKLELFYPYKPYYVGQKFGESLACTEDTPAVPIGDRKIVSKSSSGICPIGYVELYPLLGLKNGHPGEDLYAPHGVILRAPHDGIVKETQLEPARGLGVGIITNDQRDMGQYGIHYAKTRQWHLMEIWVTLGQEVKAGDPIGLADSTGMSAGDHNHFELKPVEYDAMGNHYNVFQENGFYGAIDPALFWGGNYAQDFRNWRSIVDLIRQQLSLIQQQISQRSQT